MISSIVRVSSNIIYSQLLFKVCCMATVATLIILQLHPCYIFKTQIPCNLSHIYVTTQINHFKEYNRSNEFTQLCTHTTDVYLGSWAQGRHFQQNKLKPGQIQQLIKLPPNHPYVYMAALHRRYVCGCSQSVTISYIRQYSQPHDLTGIKFSQNGSSYSNMHFQELTMQQKTAKFPDQLYSVLFYYYSRDRGYYYQLN